MSGFDKSGQGVGVVARFTQADEAGNGVWAKAQSLPATRDQLQKCHFGVGVIGETLMVVAGAATHDDIGCGSLACTGEACCPKCPPPRTDLQPDTPRLADHAWEQVEVEVKADAEEDDESTAMGRMCYSDQGQLVCK